MTSHSFCLIERRASYCVGAGYQYDTDTRVLDLTVSAKRTDCYSLTELTIDPEFDGRAFTLGKLSGGTDVECEGYTLFVSHHGPLADNCECRGFTFKHRCKHLSAIRSMMGSGWV